MSNTHTAERLEFVEEVGLFFERGGLTRMAGRMLGWLLVCDPPHQSMNELAEALQASKGSISGTARFLIQVGLVERLSLPGERRDYFRIPRGAWLHVTQNKMNEITRIRELAERGLTLLDSDDPDHRERLEHMRDMYAFFEDEIPRLLERWEQHAARR
jgi:DNA-binding transcriptional regulator GbsR (MarR family)